MIKLYSVVLSTVDQRSRLEVKVIIKVIALIDRVNIGKSRLMPVPEIPKSILVFFKFFILADEEIIIWSLSRKDIHNILIVRQVHCCVDTECCILEGHVELLVSSIKAKEFRLLTYCALFLQLTSFPELLGFVFYGKASEDSINMMCFVLWRLLRFHLKCFKFLWNYQHLKIKKYWHDSIQCNRNL